MADTFKFVQSQTFSLAGSGISIGATSLTLQSFTLPDGTLLTMSDFGSKGFVTIEPNNFSQEEQISFTGVTQNANGTATLSGIKTVLNIDPYTESSGIAISHPGGAACIVTNTALFYSQFAAKGNDETIEGLWNFDQVPSTDQDPVNGDDIARRSWVLSVVNGGPVSQESVAIAANAGETIVAGNLVYFSETDNEWLKTDADVPTTIQSTQLGIAQGAGTNGNPISGGVVIIGTDQNNTGLTPGDLMYASNTAGGISTTPGTTPRVIGMVNAAGNLLFNPFFQSELQRYVADTGSLNALAATLPGNFNAYYNGMVVSVKVANTNTLTSTLSVNGGPAVTITKGTGVALTAGDLLINTIASFMYNSTGPTFQLITPPANIYPIVQVFTANGTWTKPAGAKFVIVECVGGGGGGGGGAGNGQKGSGGGGGASSFRRTINASGLPSTVSVTVGAGGAGGTGATTVANGANGTAGGSSNFGSYVFGYGGGPGAGAGFGNSTFFGGGGGGSAGNASSTTAVPGIPVPAANSAGISGQGAYGGVDTSIEGKAGEYGGGGGAATTVHAIAQGAGRGGDSIFSCGGGGAGGDVGNVSNSAGPSNGTNGGGTGSYSVGGGGAGGSPANSASNGSNGASASGYGNGQGGGGGAASRVSNAGHGGLGGTPGGGGGGGGSANITGLQIAGNGGNGGNGEVRVYTWA